MSDDALLRLLPPIRRARDYRLYGENGARHLDLWLDGGRALLGHRPEGVLTELKNQLAKGLLADLPSIQEGRLSKALSLLMPGYREFRVYRSLASLLRAVSPLQGSLPGPGGESAAGGSASSGGLLELEALPDPAVTETAGLPLALWRPFLSEATGSAAVAVPVLPFPLHTAPVVAAFRDPPGSRAGAGEIVSPVLLAGMTKSIYQLIRFRAQYTDDMWRRFDAPYWRRRGPYLVSEAGPDRYRELFEGLLTRGIVISPRYPGPSIVPARWSDGEIKPLHTYGLG